MIDNHQNYYHTIATNIIVNPALACELLHQWEYHNNIHSQIASWLHQTSWLKGFTGTLLPGTCERDEPSFIEGGLLQWAINIFGLVEMHEQVDTTDDTEDMMENEESAKEVAANESDLVIQLLENILLQDNLDISSD